MCLRNTVTQVPNKEISSIAATKGLAVEIRAVGGMSALILLFMMDITFIDDYSIVDIGFALNAAQSEAKTVAQLRWPQNRMECRYNHANSPFDLSVVEAVILEAGQAWELKSGLAFEYRGTTSDKPGAVVYDCLISWDLFPSIFKLGQAQNYRMGNTLVGTDIRISRWVAPNDLLLVLKHEIGHGLGLDHDHDGCIMHVSPSRSQLCFSDYAAITHLYPPYEIKGRPALDCTVNLLPNQEVYIPSIDGRYWARYRLDGDLNMTYIEHGEIGPSDLFLCRGYD